VIGRAALRRGLLALVLPLGVAGALELGTAAAFAQDKDNPAPQQLSGTLARAHARGAVTIAYRAASIPFSFRIHDGDPQGYSIDLCRAIVAAIGDELGSPVAIDWMPVTSESRIPAIVSGKADLECGSTTANAERATEVDFSPIFFVSGTKLMVRRGGAIKTYRDLKGRTVIVTSGTTNEKVLHDLDVQFHLGLKLLTGKDHDESYARFSAGEADAFATDDVLLQGLIAKNRSADRFAVSGDFLSFDPYGIMFEKGDRQLAALIARVMHDRAQSRDWEQSYQQWFMTKLPDGERINLPMSPQLAEIIASMKLTAD